MKLPNPSKFGVLISTMKFQFLKKYVINERCAVDNNKESIFS